MLKRLAGVVVITAAMTAATATAAFAGEVTGNGKSTAGPAHANSICVFSGQNDDPTGENPENGPPGRTQSYGQDVRNGLFSPSTENPGKVGRGEFTLHPGFACNGEHGFFSGDGEE